MRDDDLWIDDFYSDPDVIRKINEYLRSVCRGKPLVLRHDVIRRDAVHWYVVKDKDTVYDSCREKHQNGYVDFNCSLYSIYYALKECGLYDKLKSLRVLRDHDVVTSLRSLTPDFVEDWLYNLKQLERLLKLFFRRRWFFDIVMDVRSSYTLPWFCPHDRDDAKVMYKSLLERWKSFYYRRCKVPTRKRKRRRT